MGDHFLDVFHSTQFEFVIEGKSTYLHEALVAKVSKPLERMMNNGMLETHERRMILEDEDEGTFGRFSHWAYAGFYTPAEFSERVRTGAQLETVEKVVKVQEPTTGFFDEDGVWYNLPGPISRDSLHKSPTPVSKDSRRKVAAPVGRDSVGTAFATLRFCKADNERPRWTPRPNTKASEDYTDVFLSHARLYTFAEKYDIQPLKRLCLRNIHQTLLHFILWPECISDVVALLQFAYENTVRPEEDSEPLRHMLSQFVAVAMIQLMKYIPFRDLLAEDRDFLDDFLHGVEARLNP